MPVIAFVEDVAASGGYMIACAADEIIADPSLDRRLDRRRRRLVRRPQVIEKIGIERRLYTSGENKAMLDPFLPEKPDDVARLKAIQHDIHDSFIALVKEQPRRKLTAPTRTCSRANTGPAHRARARSCRSHRRLRSVAARALRRQGRDAAGLRRRAACSAARPASANRRSSGLRPAWRDDIVAALDERALWSRFGLYSVGR